MTNCGVIGKYERFCLPLSKKSQAEYVTVTAPSGEKESIPVFLNQPIELVYDSLGYENTEKTGDPVREMRYTPTECGIYTFDDGGELYELSTIESENHGYVKVSDKDKRCFEYSDGKFFLPIGINLAFLTQFEKSNQREFGTSNEHQYLGLREYERWFKKCSENGVNLVRIWLGHEYLSPDKENVDELKIEQFSKLDKIFELARKYNILLKLTFEQFRYFSDQFQDTNFVADKMCKCLKLNGKNCKNMAEWLETDAWRNAWLKKIEEYAKRYSGDTTVFTFELWNEMSAASGGIDRVMDWNRDMLPKLRKMFTKNMIVNSFGSFDSIKTEEIYNRFSWGSFDFKQVHSYLDCGAEKEICHHSLIELMKDDYKKNYTKEQPVIIAETGAVNNCHSGPFRYYGCDDRGIIFADCVYTPFFVGFAGCGNIWHWDNRYVESKGLFKMFKPFYELTAGVDFFDQNFKYRDLSIKQLSVLALEGRNTALVYVRNMCDNWENTLRDMKDPQPQSANFSFGRNIKSADVYKIWDDDMSEVSVKDDVIEAKNVNFGTFIKICFSE